MQETFQLDVYNKVYLTLLQLSLSLILLSHWFACIWNYIGEADIEMGSDQNWISQFQFQNTTFGNRYIKSIYYAIITITTIGYGDISPQNEYEMIFVSFMAIIASGVFAFIINEISNIMVEIKQREEQYKIKLSQMNIFLQQRNVNQKLQIQARNYLQYVFKEGINNTLTVQNSLTHINKHIQQEIIREIYLKTLKKIPIFREKFSSKFLEALSLKIKEQTYGPDELIVKMPDPNLVRLWVVFRGNIEIFIPETNTVMGPIKPFEQLSKGEFFGLSEFFQKQMDETYTIRSLGVSQLQYLDYKDFYELLIQYPVDHEMFFLLRDNLIFKQNYQSLNIKCYSCKSASHTIGQCPYIYYNPNTEKLINKYRLEIDNYILNFQRKKKVKELSQPLENLSYYQSQLLQFWEVNDDFLDQIALEYEYYEIDDEDLKNPDDSQLDAILEEEDEEFVLSPNYKNNIPSIQELNNKQISYVEIKQDISSTSSNSSIENDTFNNLDQKQNLQLNQNQSQDSTASKKKNISLNNFKSDKNQQQQEQQSQQQQNYHKVKFGENNININKNNKIFNPKSFQSFKSNISQTSKNENQENGGMNSSNNTTGPKKNPIQEAMKMFQIQKNWQKQTTHNPNTNNSNLAFNNKRMSMNVITKMKCQANRLSNQSQNLNIQDKVKRQMTKRQSKRLSLINPAFQDELNLSGNLNNQNINNKQQQELIEQSVQIAINSILEPGSKFMTQRNSQLQEIQNQIQQQNMNEYQKMSSQANQNFGNNLEKDLQIMQDMTMQYNLDQFDMMKIFKIYFPEFNYDNILKQLIQNQIYLNQNKPKKKKKMRNSNKAIYRNSQQKLSRLGSPGIKNKQFKYIQQQSSQKNLNILQSNTIEKN